MESKSILIGEKEESVSIKLKNKFTEIKSDYFLERVFNYMHKVAKLKIIKNNKNIQKRLKININDYKEYSEIYSSIEIEIIPKKNEYGKYINIKEGDKKYYHIYFNDNKKDEIKRTYLNKDEQISKINIIIDYQIISFSYLFSNCYCIESINFKKFYRNNINDMSGMFHGCSYIKELNLSNFNTNNVNDTNEMFYKCSSLEQLNISNFNTNNIQNMSAMFYECSSLKELDVSNFNTNNETNLFMMFAKCKSLKELNLSNFKTDKVEMMYTMFYGCSEELINKIKSIYKNFKEGAFDTILNLIKNNKFNGF